MSTTGYIKDTCAVCGNTSEYNVLMSTNAFGSMDLDTRPPQMKRGTMNYWVQRCPDCGYVSTNVSDETTVTEDFVSSFEYISNEGIEFISPLADKFYKFYMISIHDGNYRKAFFALLHAAWACDDEGDIENAKLCRYMGAELSSVIDSDGSDKEFAVMRADMLRRMGDFDKVINEYENIEMGEELLQKIIEFEVLKAKERDDAVYKVSDVEDN